MGRAAMFPGTFDPVTMGHVDIMTRAVRVFDDLVVAVADQHHKTPLFSADERVRMIRESLPPKDRERVKVEVFRGLLVQFAKKKGVDCIVRGLRVISDFEYELQMAFMNQGLAPDIETVFMAPQPRFSFINSTLVKEVARHGGSLTGIVSPYVDEYLRNHYGTKSPDGGRGGSAR